MEKMRNAYIILVEKNPKGRCYSEDLGVNRRTLARTSGK
jgi:hypothetical protein